MRLNKGQEQEILSMIQGGYNIDSVVLAVNKKYPSLKISKSDILIIARKNGYHNFGKKDITTTKGKIKDAGDNISVALTHEPMMKKIKNTLIGLLIAVVLLLVCLYVLFGLKTFLITFCVVLGLFMLVIGFIYFGYVKGNKTLHKQVKNYMKNRKR